MLLPMTAAQYAAEAAKCLQASDGPARSPDRAQAFALGGME